MSGRDVAARLSDGMSAVADLQTRIADVCAPDTVRDRYAAEAGLELRLLDEDAATLRQIAAAATSAQDRMGSEAGVLAAAWSGVGGAAGAESVRRQCATAGGLVDALEAAARACQALADALWQVVDDRVARTIAVAERAGEQQESAEALSAEWLAAMGQLDARAESAYRSAADGLTALGPIRFDLPGDFGPLPVASPPVAAPLAAPLVAQPAPAPPPPPAPPPMPALGPTAPFPAMTAPPLDQMTPPLDQVAPPPFDPPGLPKGVDSPSLHRPHDDRPEETPEAEDDDPDEKPNDNDDAPEETSEEDDDAPEETPEAEGEAPEEASNHEEPQENTVLPAPAPAPAPEPAPEPEPATPCEIAADELAQVGE